MNRAETFNIIKSGFEEKDISSPGFVIDAYLSCERVLGLFLEEKNYPVDGTTVCIQNEMPLKIMNFCIRNEAMFPKDILSILKSIRRERNQFVHGFCEGTSGLEEFYNGVMKVMEFVSTELGFED